MFDDLQATQIFLHALQMLLYLTLSRIVSKCLSGPTVLHLNSWLSDQKFFVAIRGESLCGANLQSIKCVLKCEKR